MNPFDLVISVFSGVTSVSTLLFLIKVWPILRRIGTVLDQHDMMWSEYAQRHGLIVTRKANGDLTYGKSTN